MIQGTVKCSMPRKGFGFITQDGGDDEVFVHFSAIQTQGYKSLTENQRVELDVTQGPRCPRRRTCARSRTREEPRPPHMPVTDIPGNP